MSEPGTTPASSLFPARRLELVPVTFAQAAEWNAEHHRHHPYNIGFRPATGKEAA